MVQKKLDFRGEKNRLVSNKRVDVLKIKDSTTWLMLLLLLCLVDLNVVKWHFLFLTETKKIK